MSSSGRSNGMASPSLFATREVARLMARAVSWLRVPLDQFAGLSRWFQDVRSGVVDRFIESCITVAVVRPIKRERHEPQVVVRMRAEALKITVMC